MPTDTMKQQSVCRPAADSILPRVHDDVMLRPAQVCDFEAYWSRNYCPVHPDLVKFTGCQAEFDKDAVRTFFENSITAADRLFLLMERGSEIIGEAVLTEIVPEDSASFRIAIFHPEDCSGGLGTWVLQQVLEIAFTDLKLQKVELEVFSCNPRARRVYEKCGFEKTGEEKNVQLDNGTETDVILMEITQDQWKQNR